MLSQYKYVIVVKGDEPHHYFMIRNARIIYDASIFPCTTSLNKIIDDHIYRIEMLKAGGGCIWNKDVLVMAMNHPNQVEQLERYGLDELLKINFGDWDMHCHIIINVIGTLTSERIGDMFMEYLNSPQIEAKDYFDNGDDNMNELTNFIQTRTVFSTDQIMIGDAYNIEFLEKTEIWDNVYESGTIITILVMDVSETEIKCVHVVSGKPEQFILVAGYHKFKIYKRS